MFELKIGYLNIRGLSLKKWEYCLSLMDNIFDILYITETWYMNTLTYSVHPYYLTSSPKPQS